MCTLGFSFIESGLALLLVFHHRCWRCCGTLVCGSIFAVSCPRSPIGNAIQWRCFLDAGCPDACCATQTTPMQYCTSRAVVQRHEVSSRELITTSKYFSLTTPTVSCPCRPPGRARRADGTLAEPSQSSPAAAHFQAEGAAAGPLRLGRADAGRDDRFERHSRHLGDQWGRCVS